MKALVGAAVVVFAILASQVVLGGYLVTVADPAVTQWFVARRSEELTAFFTLFTQVHSTLGIDLMLACAAALAWFFRKDGRVALWLIIAVQSSMLLNVLLKNAFTRVRPAVDVPLVHLSTYSFPSGHALASTVFWACVWLLLPAGRARAIAGVVFAGVVALVCLSRVYLGAHFLTDVVAGVAEGLLCATAWGMVLSKLAVRASTRDPVRS